MSKRCVNASTSPLKARMWAKITYQQALVILIMFFITAGTLILFVLTQNLIAAILIPLFLIIFTIILLINNCWTLTFLLNFFKFIFASKSKKINDIKIHKGLVNLNNRKLIFFEINCSPLTGTEEQKLEKIETFADNLKFFKNFSIINTFLPFSGLEENKESVETRINNYLKSKANKNIDLDNDIVLQNLLVNKVLLNRYIEGEYKKNTYLLAFELDDESNVNNLISDIKSVNKSLAWMGFSISIIDDEIADFVKKEMFLCNKRINININDIKVEDEYYHFFKIDGLPNELEPAYLDFINDLGNGLNVDINFTINTYSIKNLKKEDKLWEKALKHAEQDIEYSKRKKDLTQAESDYEAAEEMIQNLVANKSITQKYEIIVCLKAKNKKSLSAAKRQVKQYLKRKELYTLEESWFVQYQLFLAFNRSIYEEKLKPRAFKILPNDIIAYSYPFVSGNNYLDSGFYLGELTNGNPVFLSLNLGRKENNSSLIIGATGSGKTTFMNFILKNNMSEQNVTTIVLDPKGEYASSSNIKKMNPKVIGMSDEQFLTLNPFDLSINENNPNKVEFILTYLKVWFGNDWNLAIENKLTKAIVNAINKKKYDIEGVYEETKAVIKKSTNNSSDEIILATLEKILPDGIFNYFSKPTKLNFSKKDKLIIFNLNELLQNFNEINKIKIWLLFRFLKSFIYTEENRDEANKNKIQLLIDEFPVLLNPQAPFIGQELVSMARLVRSYDASLVLIMQDVATLFNTIRNDAVSSTSLSSLTNNAEHIFLMAMNQEQLNLIKTIWGDSVTLTEDENLAITSRFSKGDILYLNKSNRYYFNSTDPLSNYSDFNVQDLHEDIELLLNNLLKNKEIVSKDEATN